MPCHNSRQSLSFRRCIVLLAAMHLSAAACLKPSGERARPEEEPTTRQRIDEQESESKPAEAEKPPKPMSAWRRVVVTFRTTPGQPPRPAVVGFDEVAAILGRDEYGSCMLCHDNQWPYLGSSGVPRWDKFLTSLDEPGSPATNKEELAQRLVDCVDPNTEAACGGEPETPDDNEEYKMPVRFGYDTVSPRDLDTLRQWIADGVQEFSQDATPGGPSGQIESIALGEMAASAVEAKFIADSLTHLGDATNAEFDVRYEGDCSGKSLLLKVNTAGGADAKTLVAPLVCEGNVLAGSSTVSF